MKEHIVITGMGAVTPIGIGIEHFWKGLVDGVPGIHSITRFDTTNLPVTIAAEVRDFEPTEYMPRKLAKEMDLFMQYGYVAAEEAMKDAGLDTELPEASSVPAQRIGVVVGTAFAGIATIAETQNGISTGVHSKVSPRFVPKIIGNIAAAQIAIAKGLRGPSLTVTTACSSGADALSTGIMLINSGEADVVLCVGAEAATSPLPILGLASAHALSTRNDSPATASRPFDASRDGFVMGEGGGCIIIETEAHAKARGAHIHASIIGWANSTDGYHVTSPHPEGIGAVFCMQRCMEKAGIQPTEVDYINAHGTSTPKGDIIETIAIKKLFGSHAGKLAVSSTKGSTGHMMGAGGITETIACVKAIQDGIIPPTLNLETPDPECDLDYVPNTARKQRVEIAMSNAFGFGGQNSSILLKKYR
ncbi:MAG: beta-ketoacyl-ACP synthase II [Bacteroides sp.]|nr:beta-ketoacyl-ACP synthase II [Bacteroides sp.]MCM1549417.1 beta-ketoacyl-ACP synthase II [Clostridium sp.]